MADAAFKFSGVYVRYADKVQRLAVLHPLTGRRLRGLSGPAAYAEGVRLAAAQVVRLRRRRLSQLAGAGWYSGTTPLRSQGVRNCSPAFAYAEPRMWPCRCWWCPFCHARSVSERWTRLDAAFTSFERPCWLVTRHRAFALDYREDAVSMIVALHELFQGLVTQRRRAFELAGSVYGGAAFATIAPAAGEWSVCHRQLFLVPEGYVVPESLLQTGGEGQVCAHTHESPTRRIFMEAVAGMCRYPEGLLRSPDLPQLIALLRARTPAWYTDAQGRTRVRRTPRLYAARGALY